MANVFLIDLTRCNGCRNCQIVCKDEHCGQPWMPYAEEQPETGHFWMKVTEKTRGQVPVVKVSYRPTLCCHCDEAPCAQSCLRDAFTRRADGLLLIDPEACDGCGACVPACPIGAIYFNDVKNIAQKCTGCAHLLDDGWIEPRCVDACATGALRFGEESAFDLSGAVCLEELSNVGSRVYYRGLPKRFVAGCAVDLACDEVVIGASVMLCDEGGACLGRGKTDEFGDFSFEQIEAGVYEIALEAEGYAKKAISVDVRDEDRCVGDIDLSA